MISQSITACSQIERDNLDPMSRMICMGSDEQSDKIIKQTLQQCPYIKIDNFNS